MDFKYLLCSLFSSWRLFSRCPIFAAISYCGCHLGRIFLRFSWTVVEPSCHVTFDERLRFSSVFNVVYSAILGDAMSDVERLTWCLPAVNSTNETNESRVHLRCPCVDLRPFPLSLSNVDNHPATPPKYHSRPPAHHLRI